MDSQLTTTVMTYLDLTGYHNDKRLFTKKFLSTCCDRALLTIFQNMPLEWQQEIIIQLGDRPTDEQINEVIGNYIPQEKFDQQFKQTIRQALWGYFQSISPILSLDKQQNLQSFLASLSKN